jgi:hypothetical protein
MSEIERLRALLAEATPGPWRARKWDAPRMVEVHAATKPPVVPWSGFDDSSRTKTEHDANATLIAAAVNALPALLDVAEAAAKSVEWADVGGLLPGDVTDVRAALDRLDGAS